MDSHGAPLRDMRFMLEKLAGLGTIATLPGCEDAEPEMVFSILEQAERFASGVLAPLNRTGDIQGCRLEDGRVRVPDGWQEAWNGFVEGGWLAMSVPVEQGGMGLPKTVWAPVWEMCFAANHAFTMLPQLSAGCAETLAHAASEPIRELYLPKIVSGEWACNMSLTEPQAGSDLAAVRMRAEPAPDGSYRLSGQKIFISYGDHELAANIVHLVLARLPDAPPGIRGLSLFLVPKFLPDADGNPGARNDVHAVALEHKLGIHGSPTCTLAYGDQGGAVGYLVGEANRGIEHMFVMLNDARFAVSLHGPGLGERAYRMALQHARERVQGRVAGAADGAPILLHPDVKRQLLSMRTRLFAMRALAYTSAAWFDHAAHNPDPAEAARCQRRIDLLMPVLKAWNTETGNRICDDAIQVFGGAGYIEETGISQHYRDSRVTRIYEGTTGIQANDLVGRKLLRDQGASLRELLDEIRAEAGLLLAMPSLVASGRQLLANADELSATAAFLLAHEADEPAAVRAAAEPFLHLCGLVCAGWRVAQAARAARLALDAGEDEADYLKGVLAISDCWFATFAPQVHAHGATVRASRCVSGAPESAFLS